MKRAIEGHEVMTVPEAGLAGKTNGELLAQIDGRFDVFITVDQNLQSQQQIASRAFGVIVLVAPSNRIDDLLPLVARLLNVLTTIGSGDIVQISHSG
ncbi:MAG TPA: hypothetical protein PLJ47_07590 [Candidatus Hydrogenedentes bacterium]|nr:hypothetical protein [Candidatus Hydrogenedentota bacterium]